MNPSPNSQQQSYTLLGKTPFSEKNKPTILMCPPNYFEVAYAINPWMDTTVACDVELAKKQWENLYKAIESVGADVELLNPEPGLPDLVFTANAGFVYNDNAVVAHYRHPERQPEETFAAAWFKNNGFNITILPDNVYFEGSGDALIWGDYIFAGYKARSSIEAHVYLEKASGLKAQSLELGNLSYYHSDVCLCPLDKGDFIYAPEIFNEESLKKIESVVPEEKRIAVSLKEASNFACNAVSIHDAVIFHAGSTEMEAALQKKGYHCIQVDLSEFIKAGGSAKCLTNRLG